MEKRRRLLQRPGLKRKTPEVSYRKDVAILDETTPGNVLSDTSRIPSLLQGFAHSHFSREGFARNADSQKSIGNFIDAIFIIRARGPVLDVGYGANTHVAQSFAAKGIETCGIDTLTAKTPLKAGVGSAGASLWLAAGVAGSAGGLASSGMPQFYPIFERL